MRIGQLFSRLLDPASDLFSDQQGKLGWADEVLWEGAITAPPAKGQWEGGGGGGGGGGASASSPSGAGAVSPKTAASVAALAAAEARGPDSDDDSGDSDSDDGLPSFDVREDPEEEAWRTADPK